MRHLDTRAVGSGALRKMDARVPPGRPAPADSKVGALHRRATTPPLPRRGRRAPERWRSRARVRPRVGPIPVREIPGRAVCGRHDGSHVDTERTEPRRRGAQGSAETIRYRVNADPEDDPRSIRPHAPLCRGRGRRPDQRGMASGPHQLRRLLAEHRAAPRSGARRRAAPTRPPEHVAAAGGHLHRLGDLPHGRHRRHLERAWGAAADARRGRGPLWPALGVRRRGGTGRCCSPLRVPHHP